MSPPAERLVSELRGAADEGHPRPTLLRHAANAIERADERACLCCGGSCRGVEICSVCWITGGGARPYPPPEDRR